MIRYMRLQIPYNEFEQLLSKYFQQQLINQIKLAYVDESTIQVSAVVKIKQKFINVDTNYLSLTLSLHQ